MEDLELMMEFAEDLADGFGPYVMTDQFWQAFRQIVEETALAPVAGVVN
jgi:hypothetical protein